MVGLLQELQDWYRSRCDGEWEHGFGVKIGTLDNPGWSLTIDLVGSGLEGKAFQPVSRGVGLDSFPEGTEWLVCKIEANQFHGFVGPSNLEEMIRVFLRWKDEP